MLKNISEWFRKRRIRKLVSELPVSLAKRFGKSDFYTKGQIEKTLDEKPFDQKYRGYAYVLCMELEEAAEVIGSVEVSEIMAQELSVWFFNGQRDFRSRWFVRTPTTEARHLAD